MRFPAPLGSMRGVSGTGKVADLSKSSSHAHLLHCAYPPLEPGALAGAGAGRTGTIVTLPDGFSTV